MLTENTERFLNSEVAPRPASEAFFHVIPVPYEASVSYGAGTSRGPRAILQASDQLELWDGEREPGSLGIFTHQPVDCLGQPEEVLARIEQATTEALKCYAMPVLLGGEHTLTYGALAALKKHYGTFGIVQFDAHADLRDTYEDNPWSHACVMRRAVHDLGLPLVQLGNRLLCREEAEARLTYSVTSWDAAWLARNPIPENLIPSDFPARVFITFDIDGLDPSLIPATGTPVPGGLSWYQALDLAEAALKNRTLIGFDLVELSPQLGHHASDFAAARLVYALMSLGQKTRPI